MNMRAPIWALGLVCLAIGAASFPAVREYAPWFDFNLSPSITIGVLYIGCILLALMFFTRK